MNDWRHGRQWARIVLIGLGVCATCASSYAAEPSALTAREIMTRNFFVSKVAIVRSHIVLTLRGRGGHQQTRRLTFVARLQADRLHSDVLARFSYPADIRGTSFLERQHPITDNLWIYLPALHNVRRLVTNNKRNSFFGTDFSYGDILPSRVSEYRYIEMGSAELHQHACYIIASWPIRPGVARSSGYGHKLSWIRKDDFMAIRTQYYDRSGVLLKTGTANTIRPLGSDKKHWIAMDQRMVNQQTGHSTTLQITALHVGVALRRGYFTARTLKDH